MTAYEPYDGFVQTGHESTNERPQSSRVSTAQQTGSGASLEAQRDTLSAAADQRLWDLVDVIFDEAESGGKGERGSAVLPTVIARIEAAEADALAVAKLDRLSCSVKDLADEAERGKPRV